MQKTQLHQHTKIAPKRVLASVVALLVFFLLLTSVVGLVEKHQSIRRRIGELDREQGELQAKKTSLEAINSDLESPQGKEYALRTKYNLVRPGEGMIVVTNTVPLEMSEPDTRPRVVRWWDSLLHGLGLRKE